MGHSRCNLVPFSWRLQYGHGFSQREWCLSSSQGLLDTRPRACTVIPAPLTSLGVFMMQSDMLSKHTRGLVSLLVLLWVCPPMGSAETYCREAGIYFNQVDTAEKEDVYCTQIHRKRRHGLPCRATCGSTRVSQEAEGGGRT